MPKRTIIISLVSALVVGTFSFFYVLGTTSPKEVSPIEGMVYLKGGTFASEDPNTRIEEQVYVKPFYIDKNLVTVADFEAFVSATGYKTEAEVFGNSPVFDFQKQSWDLVDGADFRYPFGPQKAKAEPNHPVTQVSWNDAKAYAKWKGKRLPTKREWEWAASSAGKAKGDYAWGSNLIQNGKYKANTWQGDFPEINTKEDGFLATSPVGYFGSNSIGLSDMGGNVWQWTLDPVRPTPEEALQDTAQRIVTKGGSFLCDPKVCHGFKINGQSSTTPETGLCHTGFRCVKDI